MLRWGIIGVGAAGRARARAIQADPRSRAVAGFRGQPEAVGLPPAQDLGSLLRACDAVTICAPDRAHPELVRLCLSEGKHVLVEYPLAGSAEVGAELFDLARRFGRLLHVGHIEVLGPVMARLRGLCRGRRLLEGSLRFTSPPRKGTYGVASANLARLHRILDLLGPPDALRLVERGPQLLRAALRFGEARLDLDLRHGEDQPRALRLRLRLEGPAPSFLELHDRQLIEDGVPVALPEHRGLFLEDQLAASARILDGAPPYVDEARVLQLLALGDALVRASPEGGFTELRPGPRPPG